MTDRRALGTAAGMNVFVHVRASFGVLGLVSMLVGCDPKSTEVGATVANFGAPSDDGGGSSDTDTGAGAGALDCEVGVPIVSGTVERELQEHTWNEPFIPNPDAHVSLLLVSYYVDGTSIGRAERDVPFEALPFDFVICGDPEAAFAADEENYEVWVNVYNHDTTELRVGDLADEYIDEVEGPTEGLEVVVSGVEHCDAPYAGGLCSTIE